MKCNEAIDNWPFFDGSFNDHLFGENDCFDVLKLGHSCQDFFHWFGQTFLFHGTNANDNFDVGWFMLIFKLQLRGKIRETLFTF